MGANARNQFLAARALVGRRHDVEHQVQRVQLRDGVERIEGGGLVHLARRDYDARRALSRRLHRHLH